MSSITNQGLTDIFIFIFFHRKSNKLKISESKTHQNNFDDESPVSYLKLVCEHQLITDEIKLNDGKYRKIFIEFIVVLSF